MRVVRDRGRVQRTPAGAVRVFGTVQDVTDEQEIRETVRRIGETIDEYYFTDELRPDGTYEPIFATSAIHRLLGGIPEGMTYGEAWHAAVHPDDRPLASSLVERLRAGESIDVEYRMVGFDGMTRWVWVRCAVRETLADGTRILDGVAQDVTLRRDAQARLSEIAEAIDEVLYVEEHYADGRIVETYSSNGIHKLFGLGPEEPLPDWRPYVHPEDRSISDELDENLRQLVAGRRRVPADRRRRARALDPRPRATAPARRRRDHRRGHPRRRDGREGGAAGARGRPRRRPTAWPASIRSRAPSTAGTSPRRSSRSWPAPAARAPAPACWPSTSTTSRS